MGKLKSILKRCWSALWDGFTGSKPSNFVDARVSAPVVANDNPEPTPAQIRYADIIAKQIEVEQGLSSTRMTWNLTFQGFTIAAYALVASSNGTTPAKGILGAAIGISSALIAYVTMRGVVASQHQRKYLKDCWAANNLSRYFPEPFSEPSVSALGRWPSYTICLVLMLMWAILLITPVWSWDDKPTQIQIVPFEKQAGS